MKFLLKIVQGPNAGAEIALVEGVNLTFGCGDECDIILSDTSVGEKAFELEVTSERVVAVMPGGKSIKLEPYHVTAVGASALAIGPQEGVWKSLVWPKADPEKQEVVQEEPEKNVEMPVKRPFPIGCVAAVLVFLALAALAVFAWMKYPGETKEYSRKAWAKSKEALRTVSARFKKESVQVEALPAESLDEVAADCGFSVVRQGEEVLAKGDFDTRVKRLEATARAYAAHPGLKVDFSDAESVSSAVRELLALVSDGGIRLDRIDGRKAFLAGCVASRGVLEKILRSLSEDVPKINAVDCAGVAVGSVDGSSAAANGESAGDSGEARPKRSLLERKQTPHRKASPRMPIAGVLSVPYPCLVLNDGTRVMEGARFGDYTIEKICSDRITVRGADGLFEWRP